MSLSEIELNILQNKTQIFGIWKELTNEQHIPIMRASLPQKDLDTILAIEEHPFQIKDMGNGEFEVSATIEAIMGWLELQAKVTTNQNTVLSPKSMHTGLLNEIQQGVNIKKMQPEALLKWQAEKDAANLVRREKSAIEQAMAGQGLGALTAGIKNQIKARKDRLSQAGTSANEIIESANIARAQELAIRNAQEKSRLAGIDGALQKHKLNLHHVLEGDKHHTAYIEGSNRSDREDLDAIYKQIMANPGAKGNPENFYPKAAIDLSNKLNDLCVELAELRALTNNGDKAAQEVYTKVQREIALQMEVMFLHAGDAISHLLDKPQFSQAKLKASEQAKAIFQQNIQKANQYEIMRVEKYQQTAELTLAKRMANDARVERATSHIGKLSGDRSNLMAATKARMEHQQHLNSHAKDDLVAAIENASDDKLIQQERRKKMDAPFATAKENLKKAQAYQQLDPVKQKAKSILATMNTLQSTAIRLQAIENQFIHFINVDPRNQNPEVDYFEKAMDERKELINQYSKSMGGRDFESMQYGWEQVFFGHSNTAPIISVPALQTPALLKNSPHATPEKDRKDKLLDLRKKINAMKERMDTFRQEYLSRHATSSNLSTHIATKVDESEPEINNKKEDLKIKTEAVKNKIEQLKAQRQKRVSKYPAQSDIKENKSAINIEQSPEPSKISTHPVEIKTRFNDVLNFWKNIEQQHKTNDANVQKKKPSSRNRIKFK